MQGRRLTLGAWLAAWAVLSGLQVLALVKWSAMAAVSGAGPDPRGLVAVLALLVLQFAKAPVTAWRLRDLGKPSDDAVLTLVPLANLGLWYQLLAGTPAPALWEKRVAAWSGQVGAMEAVLRGLRTLGRGAPVFIAVVIPAGMAYGAVQFVGIAAHQWVVQATSDQAELLQEGLLVLAAILVLAFLLQLRKRADASRASWIPMLLALPAALVALSVQFRGAHDQELLALSFLFTAIDLLWGTFLGAIVAVVGLSIADGLERGLSAQDALSGSLGTLRRRIGDVIAVHGGAYQAIMLGMQVIIPGIHYAVVYALADMCVLFEPEKPSFRRSAQLTSGIRRRVFATQVIALLPYILGSLLIGLATSSVGELVASLFDPSQGSGWVEVATGPLWILTVVVIKLSLLEIWRDRVRTLQPTG